MTATRGRVQGASLFLEMGDTGANETGHCVLGGFFGGSLLCSKEIMSAHGACIAIALPCTRPQNRLRRDGHRRERKLGGTTSQYLNRYLGTLTFVYTHGLR